MCTIASDGAEADDGDAGRDGCRNNRRNIDSHDGKQVGIDRQRCLGGTSDSLSPGSTFDAHVDVAFDLDFDFKQDLKVWHELDLHRPSVGHRTTVNAVRHDGIHVSVLAQHYTVLVTDVQQPLYGPYDESSGGSTGRGFTEAGGKGVLNGNGGDEVNVRRCVAAQRHALGKDRKTRI